MKHFLLLAIFAGSSLAQGQANVSQSPVTPQFARPQATYEEAKTFLGLTDSQVSELQKLQQEKTAVTNAYFIKVQEKRKELTQLMEAASPDATKVGQLIIEMQQLQKQGQPAPADLRDKALALLNEEQKQKLAKLDEALKDRVAADQAVQLSLLTQPAKTSPALPAMHPSVSLAPAPAATPAGKTPAKTPAKN